MDAALGTARPAPFPFKGTRAPNLPRRKQTRDKFKFPADGPNARLRNREGISAADEKVVILPRPPALPAETSAVNRTSPTRPRPNLNLAHQGKGFARRKGFATWQAKLAVAQVSSAAKLPMSVAGKLAEGPTEIGKERDHGTPSFTLGATGHPARSQELPTK